MSTDTDRREAPEYFSTFLASNLRKVDVELAEKLAELVAAVEETGKGGSLSVKFELKPLDKNGSAVTISATPTLAKPRPARDVSIAYIGRGHSLTRNDPTAVSLFDDAEVRTAPAHHAETGEIKEIPKA